MDGVQGMSAWRWVFLLEGIGTVFLAILSYFVIPDWPEDAKFLTRDEKRLLISRLAEDTGPAQMNTLDRKAARRVFTDLKILLGQVDPQREPLRRGQMLTLYFSASVCF